MAEKINEQYSPRSNPPTSEYPTGSFKDRSAPGELDGTPLTSEFANDYQGFTDALLLATSVTHSGNPDTAIDSQRFIALKRFVAMRNAQIELDKTNAELYAAGLSITTNDAIVVEVGSGMSARHEMYRPLKNFTSDGDPTVDVNAGNMEKALPYTAFGLGAADGAQPSINDFTLNVRAGIYEVNGGTVSGGPPDIVSGYRYSCVVGDTAAGQTFHLVRSNSDSESTLIWAGYRSLSTGVVRWQRIDPQAFGLGLSKNGLEIPTGDCNDITASGFYRLLSNTVNTPLGGTDGGVLIHETRSSASGTVRFVQTARGTVGGVGQSWQRENFGGTWSDWKRIDPQAFGWGVENKNTDMPNGQTQDLNTLRLRGVWRVTSATPNNPVSELGQCFVIGQGGSYTTQIVTGNTASNAGQIHIRTETAGVWGDWQRIDPQAFGIGGSLSISGGFDLNLLVEDGFYIYASGPALINAPLSGAGYVRVINRGSNDLPFQEFRKIYENRVFIRAANKASPTANPADWQPWQEIFHTGNASSGRNLETVWTGSADSVDLNGLPGGYPGDGEYVIYEGVTSLSLWVSEGKSNKGAYWAQYLGGGISKTYSARVSITNILTLHGVTLDLPAGTVSDEFRTITAIYKVV